MERPTQTDCHVLSSCLVYSDNILQSYQPAVQHHIRVLHWGNLSSHDGLQHVSNLHRFWFIHRWPDKSHWFIYQKSMPHWLIHQEMLPQSAGQDADLESLLAEILLFHTICLGMCSMRWCLSTAAYCTFPKEAQNTKYGTVCLDALHSAHAEALKPHTSLISTTTWKWNTVTSCVV